MIPKQPPIDNEFVAPGCELFASRPKPIRQLDLDLPTAIAERYAWMFGKNIEWRDLEAAAIKKMLADKLAEEAPNAARRLVGIGEWNDEAVAIITKEIVTAIMGESNIRSQP